MHVKTTLPALITGVIKQNTSAVQRLTGQSPDNLEELREIALDAEDRQQNDDVSDQSDSEEEEEEPSDHEQDGPWEEE